MATKAKMEALEKLMDVVAKYGELEAALKASELQSFDTMQEGKEDIEKADARRTALANEFRINIMRNQQGSQMSPQQGMQTEQQMPSMAMG